ncbi:hypothetical protein ACWF82_24535 [Nocardia sp. NPDC055053]
MVIGVQVHLAVVFPVGATGIVALDFRAESAVAEAFAADMNRWHGHALVTIDRAVTATMRLLPCHQLYEV